MSIESASEAGPKILDSNGRIVRRSRADAELKCVSRQAPEFLIFSQLRIPTYSKFIRMVELGQEQFPGPYGSVRRSGLEVRSVDKGDGVNRNITLGVFATYTIPQHAFVTYYGGIKRYGDVYDSLESKSHAMRIPNSLYVEDGKALAALFTRHNVHGLASYPRVDPYNQYATTYASSGVGFMFNHASRRNANCILRYVRPSPSLEALGIDAIPILLARVEIHAGTELTFVYNNAESRVW